ncbi:MAG: AbrB/MazE/SpoVT family DNA-binding domain-containing protein [Fusobacteriaceae bacterium]|nr:AbrB/MazE/SpoVT family DNA-binding domain-containing protein [Fusobacteriaceae bacterium]
MDTTILVENAKLMSKGQITIPKDIREKLGVKLGDRVTLIYKENQVIMMNSAVYAMNALQNAMMGAFEKAGLNTEDDVINMVKEIREEIESK